MVAHTIVAVGTRSKWIAEEAVACGAAIESVHHVPDNAAALAVLGELIKEKSVILVKGSRGMRMEEIVSGLSEMAGLAWQDNK